MPRIVAKYYSGGKAKMNALWKAGKPYAWIANHSTEPYITVPSFKASFRVFKDTTYGTYIIRDRMIPVTIIGLPNTAVFRTLEDDDQNIVVFCEPISLKMKTLLDGSSTASVPFLLSREMVAAIQNGPTMTLKNQKEKSNAYYFGQILSKYRYKFICSHKNIMAQTGFVLLSKEMLARGTYTDISKDMTWDKVHPILNKHNHNWGNKKVVRFVRKRIPNVLWIGTNAGGNISGSLYAATDNDGETVSLLVDNSYVF